MTDHDLIQRAREWARVPGYPPQATSAFLAKLADALEAAVAERDKSREYARIEDANATRLFKELRAAAARANQLEKAIELDAARAAYRAGLGASEWEAFVGKHSWAALAGVPAEPATEEKP